MNWNGSRVGIFEAKVVVRFQTIWDGTLLGRFLTIKQETTVGEYRNHFDKYLAPVAFLQTIVLEETFMNGLSPWHKSEVKMLEPIGLAEMMKLALKIENREMVHRECGLISVSRMNKQFKHNNVTQTSTVTPNQKPTERSWPMRTITLKKVTADEKRREGPTKRLSNAEFQALREKGLCFQCEEKYHAGHRCTVKEQKELRILVVKETREELEIIEEEYFDVETEAQTIEIERVENMNIELSINSVVGLSNPGTMKVKGKIKETKVVILIDSGATDNFIAENLVTTLSLPMTETSNYEVILGSRVAVKGKGICNNVEVTVGEWKITNSFFPLELGGVDVILGMHGCTHWA